MSVAMVFVVIPSVVEESRCETGGCFTRYFDSAWRRMTKSQRISTSAIMTFCKAWRSPSNSWGVVVDLTLCGLLISARIVVKGRGRMNRSQLAIGDQREYGRSFGMTDSLDFG